jgi:hypothetical protein
MKVTDYDFKALTMTTTLAVDKHLHKLCVIYQVQVHPIVGQGIVFYLCYLYLFTYTGVLHDIHIR